MNKLSPEEREKRRKARVARTFSDAAYKKYDPATEGYGSAEQWSAAAEAMANGKGTFARVDGSKSDSVIAAALSVLGLSAMPDIAGLKKAFRNAMFIAHPDYGGTDAEAIATMNAYKKLLESFD